MTLVQTGNYKTAWPRSDGLAQKDEKDRRKKAKNQQGDKATDPSRISIGSTRPRDYWSEFVFEAYVNHRSDVIFLAGLPDVAESRPHSRVNSQ